MVKNLRQSSLRFLLSNLLDVPLDGVQANND